MTKIIRALDTVLNSLMAVSLFCMTLFTVADVVSRTVFGPSIMWASEACRYLFVYVVFFGIILLVRDKDYLRMDILQSKIPEKFLFFYETFIQILIICFAAVIMIYGYQFSAANVIQRSPSLHIPMNYLYLVMPFSGCFAIIYSLCNIIQSYHEHYGKGGKAE